MPADIGPGDFLEHRIPRDGAWGAQAGCATAIGLFLLSLGSFFIYMEAYAEERSVGSVVGGAFALVGLVVLLLGGVHQLWARARTPETFLEMDVPKVRRGEAARFCVVQPGAADFQSLRVKLICMRTRQEWKSTSDGNSKVYDEVKLVYEDLLLEVNDLRVDKREVWHREGTFTVPGDQAPTGGAGTKDKPSFEWKIEIWGRVRRGPDVMHPFVIDVG